MKLNKNISIVLMTSTVMTGIMGFASPSQAQSVQFQCGADFNNIPTTYVETPGGVVEIFKWRSTYFQGPYTPVQRCLEVTQRMNRFQPNYLVAGRVNNYNVICSGTDCDRGGTNVLLTLRPDQDPAQVLREIDNTRDGAGGPSMQFNSTSNILNNFRRSNIIRTKDGSVALNLTGHIQTAPKVQNNFTQNFDTNTNNTTTNPKPTTQPANMGPQPATPPNVDTAPKPSTTPSNTNSPLNPIVPPFNIPSNPLPVRIW